MIYSYARVKHVKYQKKKMTIIIMMMMMMTMIKVVGEDQVKILPKSPMGERSLVPQVPSDKY